MDRILLPLPTELLALIDAAREGTDVARTVWIRRAIELRLAVRNLTNDEIVRLLDDWRSASENRERDAIDRSIATKVALMEEHDES